MANCWQVPPIKFNLYPNRWRRHSLPFHLDADTVDFHALDNHPNQDRQGPGARGPASSNFVRAERFFCSIFFCFFIRWWNLGNKSNRCGGFFQRGICSSTVCHRVLFFFLLFFSLAFSPSLVMRVINRGERDLTLRDERIIVSSQPN